jgi:hypothetical protein
LVGRRRDMSHGASAAASCLLVSHAGRRRRGMIGRVPRIAAEGGLPGRQPGAIMTDGGLLCNRAAPRQRAHQERGAHAQPDHRDPGTSMALQVLLCGSGGNPDAERPKVATWLQSRIAAAATSPSLSSASAARATSGCTSSRARCSRFRGGGRPGGCDRLLEQDDALAQRRLIRDGWACDRDVPVADRTVSWGRGRPWEPTPPLVAV